LLSPKLDFKANAFHCPHCGIYAKQDWHNVAKGAIFDRGLGFYEGFIPDLYMSLCSQCGKYALWLNDKIIYPPLSIASWPTEDMPLNVKEDFLEARNIVNSSPKAAAALLRVCLQNLMIHLGESGRNMDLDVLSLIKKGLPEKLRDQFRAVRATGVNAVRPGEINSADEVETAVALFNLINMIVESSISQRRKVNLLYTSLPNAKPLRRRGPRRKSRKSKKDEVIPKPTLLYR
jgi:hypothetical protein